MRTVPFVLVGLLLLAANTVAEPQGSVPITAELFTASVPAGWAVSRGEDGTHVKPARAAELDEVVVSECRRSKEDCLSDCNVSAARSYLWFFQNNNPPAMYRAVARKDELFEYRADGRFDRSSTRVAVAIVCGESGLAVLLSQSESPVAASSYVEEIMRTLSWRRK